jgi:hypothetical protein
MLWIISIFLSGYFKAIELNQILKNTEKAINGVCKNFIKKN